MNSDVSKINPGRAVEVVVLLLMAGLIISLILYFKAEALNEGYRQLADLWMVEMLEGEETELWPALPRTAKRMKQWLAVEEQIAACLPSYQAALAGLPVQESDEFSHHESTGPRWKHRVFSELVARLKAMHAPDTGTRDSVRKRLLEARTVYSRTILEPAAGWTEAIESIADANRCPAYEGLRIVPQIGFIPVSRNAESGLWEFEHPYTGMVFVLIPGGRFLMGSCAPESRNPDFSKQEDPNHAPDEGPATEVALAPFLLSRYEMTQAQWLHFTGDNPSNYKDYRAYPDELKPTNPVENVSYEDCSAVLQKLDFVLPTEAQWEYACRAGTTCPYSFGAKESGIGRSGNIADISYWLETRSDRSNRLINDNHFFHAPVGSFQPNRFGLHDMHGNMMEWCRDWYFSYDEVKPRPGDGLREAPAGKPGRLRVFRGGSWMSPARDARSAVRFRQRPAFRHGSIGVRPARALDPEPPRMPEK